MEKFINYIDISNFKSIKHQRIDGFKKYNIFIGYPNVGKSNILEAMATLQYFDRNYIVHLNKLCRFEGASELFFDGDVNKGALISSSNKVEVRIQYFSENHIELSSVVKNDDDKNTIGILQFINDTVQQRSNVNESLINNVKIDFPTVRKYSFNSKLNKHKTSGLWLYSPNGENLVDVILANIDLRKEISGLLKSYDLKLSIDQASNSFKALKTLEDETIFLIPFHQMADTFQRVIFFKAALHSNKESCLLFEEPEAHMFPPYIRNFANDIISDKNDNQFFINTHSPFVTNEFLENEEARKNLSLFIVDYKNGETVVRKLTEVEVDEVYNYGIDLFFNLEKYLA